MDGAEATAWHLEVPTQCKEAGESGTEELP